MKRTLSLVVWLIFSASYAFPQITLTIEVTGIKNNTGNIMLQLLDENKKIVAQQMMPANEKKCTFIIKDLKQARYAVQYYHDENLSMAMEKNRIGKPTEGYGFSNNVTAPFSMPPFEKWLFELKADKKITLKPKY
jgi:uncharacterized protein (DUF2141 family)